MEKKITKKDYFNALKVIIASVDLATIGYGSGDYSSDEFNRFLDKQIEQLDSKAAKAKERAANKKVEGDELRAAVQAVLTDEYQTIDGVTAQVEVEGVEITRAKVQNRLSQLVKAGIAEKADIKDGTRTVKGYKIAAAEDEVQTEDGDAEPADGDDAEPVDAE